jgi:hypothetical protein
MRNPKRAGMSRITFLFLSGLIAATTSPAASISTQHPQAATVREKLERRQQQQNRKPEEDSRSRSS